MIKTFIIGIVWGVLGPGAAGGHPAEYVILLHGLGRTSRSLTGLRKFLEKQGFGVVNRGYPSHSGTVEEMAEAALSAAIDECRRQNAEKIHLVTHSLGGIMVRYYLKHHRIAELGRVVMLSPPNQGSEAVDRLKGLFLFKWLKGAAGQQLGTDKNSLPARLGPVDFELGVIAGNKSLNPVLSALIPGENDGKVAVKRTQVDGMKDFLVVSAGHTFIMADRRVMKQTACFLKSGRFQK